MVAKGNAAWRGGTQNAHRSVVEEGDFVGMRIASGYRPRDFERETDPTNDIRSGSLPRLADSVMN